MSEQVPTLTPEIRAKAVERARESRTARAEARRKLESGEAKPSEVLLNLDEHTAKMKVELFIRSVPGYGPVKAEALMRELRIAPSRRLGGLGDRQRADLIARLG